MSTEGLFNAVRYGVTGIAIGAATGFLGDVVISQVNKAIQLKASTTNAGIVGQQVLNIVVSGGLGAAAIYGGNFIFESLAGDDFLAHMLFYQTAFFSSQAIASSGTSTRNLLTMLMNVDKAMTKTPPPPVASGQGVTPVTAEVAPPSPPMMELFAGRNGRTTSGCGRTGMCGGVF